MMDRSIQSNSAIVTTTASTRETTYQYELPFDGTLEDSRFQALAPLNTLGCSPDIVTGATRTLHRRPPTAQHAEMESDLGG